jgi:hypothetical protein
LEELSTSTFTAPVFPAHMESCVCSCLDHPLNHHIDAQFSSTTQDLIAAHLLGER